MKKRIPDIVIYLFVFVSLFVTNPVSNLFGLPSRVFTFSFLLLAVVFIPAIWQGIIKVSNLQIQFVLVISALLILFKMSLGQSYTKEVILFSVVPIVATLVFSKNEQRHRKLFRILVFVFYFLECALAIIERSLNVNLLPFEMVEDVVEFYNMRGETFEFRSTALLGHPLVNSLIVSMLTAFIVTDKTISLWGRSLLFSIGYVALLCFNGRAALIVVSVLLIPYLSHEIVKKSRKPFISFFVVIAVVAGLFMVLYDSDLGGRLVKEGFDDDSSRSRLLAFNFYKHITTYDLWIGGHGLYNRVATALHTSGVENGVVCVILNYGLFFAVALLAALIAFHWKLLSVYSKSSRLIILLVFFIIGSSNPNLSLSSCWLYWVIFYFAFAPISGFDKPSVRKKKSKDKRFRSISNL